MSSDLAGELRLRASGRLSSHSRRLRASCWVTRNSAAFRSAACQAALASCCARSAASAACFARSSKILVHVTDFADRIIRCRVTTCRKPLGGVDDTIVGP